MGIGKKIFAATFIATEMTRAHNRRVKLKRLIKAIKEGVTPWKK